MTNPRIYLKDKPKTFDNIDVAATEEYKNRPMPTEREMECILANADKIDSEYFRLRAKAIIGLEKIFGKRKAELSLLEMTDLSLEGKFLNITFTICKKSKKGLFQYIEFLKRQGNPELLNKPLPVLEAEHKAWNQTKDGSRFKKVRRPKQTPVTDRYAKFIVDYYLYMKEKNPTSRYLFPRGKTVFGDSYIVYGDKALTGRQILRIVKDLDSNVWMHLFRKNKGSEVARKYGRTLDSAYQVKTTLDLERTETALRYIEEFVPKLETGES